MINDYFSTSNAIRIKTDNCRVQYKCAKVFGHYKQLAIKLNKKLIIYYGAAGHGRGLVDGMSSFGVKGPLRREIINADFWWTNVSTLVSFFNSKENTMKNRNKKVYKELTYDDIERSITPVPDPLPLPYNTKQHVIVFHCDGTVQRASDLCDCIECVNGYLDKCMYRPAMNESENGNEDVSNDEVIISDEDDMEGDDNDAVDNQIQWSEVINIGAVIALRTPTDERESFYLCVVNEVCVAKEKLFDSYGHFVLNGMQYFKCNYLSVKSEKARQYVQYQKLNGIVYVVPEHIISPFVNITSDLKLSLDEKQFLDDCA